MELSEHIKEWALEKYAGDEEQANAFVEGFEKEAAMPFGTGFTNAAKATISATSPFFTNEAIGNAALKAGFGLAAGLAGAGIVKGFNMMGGHLSSTGLRNKFEMALAQVMATNRVVKGASPERAKSYAETIFKFAPNVAADPNLLGSILANAVLGEGIDSMTIKSLVDLEGRHNDNNSSGPLPTFKT